ncbi:ArdC family protein [Rothia koreensis]|uniref:ArdC family protein n=1 Tax=Rothia koreensis TaxID=592378 RepID=UPI0037C73294
MTQATTKKQDRKEAAKEKKKQIRQQYKQTAERIETDPDFAASFVDFAARFPTYSEKNQKLIFMQNDEATICAGFNKWKEEGRAVRKGEKGIKIFAPTKKKSRDENGEVIKNEKGEDEEEAGFIMVTVFDIAQTDPVEEETTN